MSTPDNPLTPRPGLSIAQRMLATGAAPDLIVQAIDEGLFEGVDLVRTEVMVKRTGYVRVRSSHSLVSWFD